MTAKLLARLPRSLRQCPYIGEDGVDEAGLGAAFRVEIEGDTLNQGGADDRGVGGARHLGGLFRGSDPKADDNRQPGEPTKPGDRGGYICGIRGAGPGDAGDRDVVDEAAGTVDDARQAPLVTGRCRQANDIEAGSARRPGVQTP